MSRTNTAKNRLPKLRVTDSQKRANKFEHTKDVMDHFIGMGTFSEEVINPDTRDVRIFYEAYNNRLPESYFRYVLNPLSSQNSDYTNWPAKIRPYTIIRPNIDLLEGEYEKRPFAYTVKVHNADSANIYQEQLYKQILASLEQQFINALNQEGGETGLPSEEVQLPEKIRAAHQSNYRDKRAEVGEAALNIIIDEQRLEEKLKLLFMDWLIAGEVYSYKGIRGGKMVYERVSPLDIDFDKSPDTVYVEDGAWVVRRMYMTPAQVLDNFYDELKESEIDTIEDDGGNLTFRGIGTGSPNTLRDDSDLRHSKVVIFHVTWKYMMKLGILTYMDPTTGEMEEMEVPETYKPAEEESVEWYWVNQVWEGYRIGAGVSPGTTNNGIYVGIKPLEGQRNTVNNLSICKLPYNGKRFSDLHSQNLSIVEMGLPYETLHRILHFQMEKTIAKSKGKIILMDQGVIPKKDGWDEEKFFYWADATGWALIDRTQPGADRSFNGYTVLDMGLYQHIENLIGLMTYVKTEWDEVLGITRQRKGQIKASDTATGTQASVQQSSVISEKVFSRFEDFVRCELQGLLDVSKLAWSDGFSAVYQGDDLRTQLLQIDPGQYTEMDMGVYISNSARDIANLEIVRQQAQSFSQNGASPSTIVDVVQARSLSKLKIALQEAEMSSSEAAQRAAQSEQEASERLVVIQNSFEELKGFIEERLVHVKYDREEDLELLKQSGMDQNPDAIIDPSAAQKVGLDDQNKKREISMKERDTANKARQKDRELDLKQHELVVRERIAKAANATSLKNKVVGERNKKKAAKK